VDDLESHSGAETMPIYNVSYGRGRRYGALAVLVEDVQALLDEQRRVQHDQAVADGQHIVAGPRLEECADRSLAGVSGVVGRTLQATVCAPGSQSAPCRRRGGRVARAGSEARQRPTRPEGYDSLPCLRRTFCRKSPAVEACMGTGSLGKFVE
jgi:hypothetical protein